MSDPSPQQHPKHARFSVISDVGSVDDVRFDGAIEYIEEFGGNASEPSWQSITGAPVENESPFGHHVGWFTALGLNVGQMVGTGIFSSPANILQLTGSVGLSLLFWAVGILIAGSQLSVYLELASYFPNRSGGQVVYLEQAFPRPRYLVPIVFAFQALILGFASGDAVVMAEYLCRAAGYESTVWQQKGLAVAGMTVIATMVVFSTKISYRISNAIAIMKVIVLLFISITGLVFLTGKSKIPNPHANFEHSFSGTSNNGFGISNALVQINLAYLGYTNAFNVVNEIKNPIKTLKRTGPASILLVGILYILVNIAYLAAIPLSTLKTSPNLASTLLLTTVFTPTSAFRASSFLFSLFQFGSIITTLITSSRILRECARQGILPSPFLLISIRPFGTPLNIYTMQYLLTIIMILAPPSKNAFILMGEVKTYPISVFGLATTGALVAIRWRRKRMGLSFTSGREGFQAWNVAIAFSALINILALITPWVPTHLYTTSPAHSRHFAPPLTSLLIILTPILLYPLLFRIIPSLLHSRIRNELITQENELVKGMRLVRVKREEEEMWNAEHDDRGRKLDGSAPVGHVLLERLDFGALVKGVKDGGVEFDCMEVREGSVGFGA